MELFSLYATLGLDTKTFDDKIKAATEDGTELRKKLEELGNPSFAPGVDANGNVFAILNDDASKARDAVKEIGTESSGAKKKIEGLRSDSAIVKGIVSGVGELAEGAIKAIIAFGEESIKAAAETGSELANAYNSAKDEFEMSLDIVKQKTGEWLLPAATEWERFKESLTGVTAEEKTGYLAGKFTEYWNASLTKVQQELQKTFNTFELVNPPEESSLSDMLDGKQSQADYWKEYAETLKAVQDMNIDPNMLAEIADGSTESLSKLQAIQEGDPETIEALMTAYAEAETVRAQVAEAINSSRLNIDENATAIIDSIAIMATEIDQSAVAGQSASNTCAAIAQGLADQYPAISGWVDTIKAKMSGLATDFHFSPSINTPNGGGSGHFAKGLDYVPYNDFPSYLHKGEAVLTAREAESWRSAQSRDSGAGINYGKLAAAMAGALNGVAVTISGERVGVLVSESVSRNIADEAYAERY